MIGEYQRFLAAPKNLAGKELSPIKAFEEDSHSFLTWVDSAIKLLKEQDTQEALDNKEVFPAEHGEQERARISKLCEELKEAESFDIETLDFIVERLKNRKSVSTDIIRGDEDTYRELIEQVLYNHIKSIPEQDRNKALQAFLDGDNFVSEINARGKILKSEDFRNLVDQQIAEQNKEIFALLERIDTGKIPHHQRVYTLEKISEYLNQNAQDDSEFTAKLADNFANSLIKLMTKEGQNASKKWQELRSSWINEAQNPNTTVGKIIEPILSQEIDMYIDPKSKLSMKKFSVKFAMDDAQQAKSVKTPAKAEEREKLDTSELRAELKQALEAKNNDVLDTLDDLDSPFGIEVTVDEQLAAVEVAHEYLLTQDANEGNDFNKEVARIVGNLFFSLDLSRELDSKESLNLDKIGQHWERLADDEANKIALSFISYLDDN
jgi:hypothetical protein